MEGFLVVCRAIFESFQQKLVLIFFSAFGRWETHTHPVGVSLLAMAFLQSTY
jgi:hypothetical protein